MTSTPTLPERFQKNLPKPGSSFPKDPGPFRPSPVPEFSFAEIGGGIETILNHSPCVTWILDVKNQSFDFISANTLEYFGYGPHFYAGKGYQFHESTKQPDDALNIKKLNIRISKALDQTGPEKWRGYKFSYDYRIIQPKGKIVRILEQNTILRQGAHRNISHLLSSCIDISHWKKSDLQVASLISQDDKQYFLFTTEIIGARPQTSLSKRELEILKLVAGGHSSKYVADKLCISFHTVNTHRQKMIEKTNTKNTGGLVQFAVLNGLI